MVQGEMHLRVTAERLERKFGITVETGRPATPYKETIRKSTTVRARHKKQSGGHGQFGDVVIEIKPRPRGFGVCVFPYDCRRRRSEAVHPIG